MKNTTKFRWIFMVLTITVLLCACGNKNHQRDGQANHTEPKKTVLTQRQIQILRDSGLPEDYEALSISQKSAITSIETMLSYLEETYQDTFTYDGYAPAFGVEHEWLTASIQQGDSEKIVTVSRTYDGKKFQYKDNYLAVVSEEEYKKAVEDYFHKVLPDAELWVRPDITQISDIDGNILARCGATSLVFVKNVFGSEQEVKKIVEDFANYMVSLEPMYPTGLDFYVQNEEDFVDTNPFNFSEKIRGDQFIYFYSYNINGDREITYYEG